MLPCADFSSTTRARSTGHCEATDWLLAALSSGRLTEALAGATAYQRLFGLVLTSAYLAKGGLAEAGAALGFCGVG